MRVKLLTTAQARNLHKRFDGWFEIEPQPAKGDRWYIPIKTLLELKEWFIDKFPVDSPQWTKGTEIQNALKDLPTYELDNYPQYEYDLNNEAELEEYTARFADLNFENVI